MNFDKIKFFENGYLSFNLQEFDNELYQNLYNLADKVKFESLIDHIRYEFSLIESFNFEEIKEIVSPFITDINRIQNDGDNIRINAKYKNDLSDLYSLYSHLESFKKNKFQYWFHGHVNSEESEYNKNLINLINLIYKRTISELYDISENKVKDSAKIDLTLYTKNGFIMPHEDGYDEGRLCVILIYLNEDYQQGFGGKLKVGDKELVKPKLGEVAILDFTKNNPKHEVLPVISENFKRFAFIKFFYLKDIQ